MKETLTRYVIMGGQLFSFSSLKMSHCCLLTCLIPNKKRTVIINFAPLVMLHILFLCLLLIFFFFTFLVSLIIMWLGIISLMSFVLCVCLVSRVWDVLVLIKFQVFQQFFLNIFCMPHTLHFPSRTPVIIY